MIMLYEDVLERARQFKGREVDVSFVHGGEGSVIRHHYFPTVVTGASVTVVEHGAIIEEIYYLEVAAARLIPALGWLAYLEFSPLTRDKATAFLRNDIGALLPESHPAHLRWHS